MNPRRVVHVLDTAGDDGTGVASIVENLATGADPARYRIELCFLKQGKLVDRFRNSGFKTTCVNWNASARNPLGAARYAALLRSGNFNIIHQHTGGRFLTALGRWLSHAKIVRHLHYRADETTGIVPSRCDLPERDALIGVAQAVADFSRDPRAVVIYPGIDASQFLQERSAHNSVVMGTACRLEPVKGLNYLLEALAILTPEFPDLRLEIAGDGSLRSLLEQQARRMGLSRQIAFLGWREDLPSVMAGWDIFVMPSLDEGLPIAALQAMAAGLPVIASAAGGLCELVQEGETGRLVPVAEPAELATRLRELILDKQKRDAMGMAGRERVLREFTVSRMVEQIVAVYDGLLSQKPAAD